MESQRQRQRDGETERHRDRESLPVSVSERDRETEMSTRVEKASSGGARVSGRGAQTRREKGKRGSCCQEGGGLLWLAWLAPCTRPCTAARRSAIEALPAVSSPEHTVVCTPPRSRLWQRSEENLSARTAKAGAVQKGLECQGAYNFSGDACTTVDQRCGQRERIHKTRDRSTPHEQQQPSRSHPRRLGLGLVCDSV